MVGSPLTSHRNIFVSSFMLVHCSGKVTCNKRDYSFWGCGKTPSHGTLFVVLTDENNKILAPEGSRVNKRGQYTLAGYTSSSSALVLCASKKSHCVFANSELRLCTARIYAASARAIMAAKHVQMCMDCWLKQATNTALKTSTVK